MDFGQTSAYQIFRPVNLTITFPRPCRGCILQIERQALDINDTFHSCADINVEQFLQNTDQIQCSGNGRLTQSGCICSKYFIGDRCQYRTDCEDNSDCLNGQCVTDSRPGLIQKFCYCDFSFFGKNCEIQSNIQNLNDECFNYKNLVDRNSAMFKAYGIFNPDCFDQRKDLNHEDFVYSRLIGNNEIEIILDFNTTGWLAIGWRPLNLDLSCRLFPNAGASLVQSALEAPLHPMDCTDILVASVVEGRSRIQDMYTRDRSTPLQDSFLQGRISFSAAFGIERDGRTVVMFRRNIQSFEQTDHPLGNGRIHGIWAKSRDGSDELRWHGAKNRGPTVFEFVRT
uniref:DOMON domain-containing protein n=1 Tax=Panagrolaimus davidi TaxID=227884 RepID=A0A914P111_9BILA